jgi:hypothetical protein
MRTLLLVLFLLVPLHVSGCDNSVLPLDEPLTCVCGDDGSGCGDDWCSYELALEPNCLGEVVHAEVMIDGHLETELLRFESVDGEMTPVLLVPCTRTEPGAKSRIDVFAGKWAWSRAGNSCETPGATTPILFGCTAE